MKYSLQVEGYPTLGLQHSTNTNVFSSYGWQMLLLLALYLLPPLHMNAASFSHGEGELPAKITSEENFELSDAKTATCNAQLEHFSGIAETSCGAKNGKIVTDPYIDRGLRLPYYIKYTYKGSTKKHGPYWENKDNYITGLAPGTYYNLTAIDGHGCQKNHGNVTVKAATCQTACTPKLTINNNGSCPVKVYHWLATGDVYKTTLLAGASWSVNTAKGQMWRVINTNQDWNNLKYDQHQTVTSECTQTWNISPTYCAAVTPPVLPPVLPACNLTVDAGANQTVCGGSVTLSATAAGASSCTGTCELSNSKVVANWNMNNCRSFDNDGSNKDFSELKAAVNSISCAGVSTRGLYTTGGVKHSCTDGAGTGNKGDAVCVGMPNVSSFRDNHPNAIRFDVTIDPTSGISGITKLTFQEFAPTHYVWSADGYNDNTGKNNYPTKYGIRVLKDGQEIYKKRGIATTQSWSLESFDFAGTAGFQSTTRATYTFELLAYSLIGNGASVSAWDLDNIKVYGGCCTPATSNTVNYAWSNGQTSATISVDKAGTYTVTATDCNGCTAVDEVKVAIDNAPAITALAANSITCASTTTQLSISGGIFASYEWTGPNGFASTEASPTVSAAGTYSVLATTANGCQANASVVVIEDTTIPTIAAASDGAITCDRPTVTLTVSGSTGAFAWTGPNGFTSTSSTPIVNAAGTYNVVVTAANGCTATASVVVTGDASVPTIAAANGGPISCDRTSVALTVSGATGTYAWTGPNGFSSTDASPTVSVSGTYTVVLTAANGCTATASTEVTGTCDPTTKIGDLVFNDLNNNGVQEAGEPGVAGIGVQLIDAGPDGDFHTADDIVVDATITDGQGLYNFDVRAGMYCIQILQNTLPTNFIFAPQDAMGNIVDAVDSDADATGKIDKFTITAGQADDLSFDAGIYEEVPPVDLPNIGDLVFNDLNNNGVQEAGEPGVAGIGVQLISAGPDGAFHTGDDIVVAADVTDANGIYGFEEVAAGQYCIQVLANTLPANFIFAPQDAMGNIVDAVDSDADALGKIPAFTVTEGQADDLSFDAGIYEEVPVVLPSIGDLVFNDLDKDGLQDVNEPGVAGIGVQLISAGPDGQFHTNDDVIVAADVTDGNGIYGFEEVAAGEYCIQIIANTIPADFVFTIANAGADDNDSDADAAGKIPAFTVTEGQADDLSFDVGISEVIPAKPTLSINDVVVNEEDGAAMLEVCLDQVATEFVYVRFTTMDDSAVAGSDYTSQANYVFIPAGQQCAKVTINLLDDTVEETEEGFKVVLSSPFNADIADGEGMVTIIDTDEPVCTAVAGTMSTSQMEVTLQGGATTIQAVPNGDADIPAGYQQAYVLTSGEGLVIVEAGGAPSFDVSAVGKYTIHSIVFDPTTLDLGIIVPGQTTGFDVNALLQQGGGAICASLDVPGAMIMVVEPEIIPSVVIGDVVVNEEDGTASISVTLSEPSTQEVILTYSTTGINAIDGVDYTGGMATITIPAGQTSATITFPILDDEIEEPTESFIVNIIAQENATILDGEGTVTILDTDNPANPTLSINDVVVKEEDGIAMLEICLNQVTTEFVYVRYTTANGTALAGSDYTTQSSYAFIPAGQQCAKVSINILDDTAEEADETFTIALSSPFNADIVDGEGTVTILDTDQTQAVVPAILINDIIVNEEDGTASLIVVLSGPTTQDVTVTYTTADASAIDGVDYTASTGTITIPAGQMSATVTFPILDDAAPESTENFVVNLSTPVNGVIADGQGTVTILDTDVAAIVPALSITDVIVKEETGKATIKICIDQPSTNLVTVRYTTDDRTANMSTDYKVTDGVASIPAGQTCVEVTVDILDDQNDEREEVFVVNLTAPSNATIADAQGTVTILDNDNVIVPPGLPNLSINDVTVNENEGSAHLQICLDRPATQTVTLDCATVNGTAIAGVDFVQTTDVATIPVGQTCTQASFRLIDDSTPESTEFYSVQLTNAVNANILDGEGTITIIDEDQDPSTECPDMDVIASGSSITVTGLTAPIEIVQVFNESWEQVFQCTNNCDATEVIDNLPAGDYVVKINCYNDSWALLCKEEIIVAVVPDTPTEGGDGTPATETPDNGTDTTGETSIAAPCGDDVTITYGNGQIQLAGTPGENYFFKVNAMSAGWELVLNCAANCGSTQTVTDLADGHYAITIFNSDWTQHCKAQVTLSSSFNMEEAARGRTTRNVAATSQVTKAINKIVATTPTTSLDENLDKVSGFAKDKTTAQVAVSLYPNPVVDQLTIDLGNLAGQNGKIYLSNQIGQVVQEVSLDHFDTAKVQLQVGQFPSGLYHLTIVADGQFLTTKKVMIGK